MNEVTDIRPARFLEAMKAYGNWDEACKKSGMTIDEVEALCQSDKDFDLAQVEATLQKVEEKMNNATYAAIEKARLDVAENYEKIKQDALQKCRERHEGVQ